MSSSSRRMNGLFRFLRLVVISFRRRKRKLQSLEESPSHSATGSAVVDEDVNYCKVFSKLLDALALISQVFTIL
jgi:hypothetical protein